MRLEAGAVLEGKVTGITAFGAFVALPEGKSGLIHISEVANTYVSDIHTFLSVGQTVKVRVLSISPEGKISLSAKRAEEPPAQEALQMIVRTRLIDGTVYAIYTNRKEWKFGISLGVPDWALFHLY